VKDLHKTRLTRSDAPHSPAHRPPRRGLVAHHEFWPSWLFYAPLIPWCAALALKARHPLAFLAANPGIEKGGGFVNESKARIMAALAHAGDAACATVLIEARADDGPAQRAARVMAAMQRDDQLAFPLILKPDAGQRGFAVKLARSEADVLTYFELVRGKVVAQQYHPGPQECGILWVRDERAAPAAGFIFAVTRKVFPRLTGDGTSTLRELIEGHPRYRRQARIFLTRFAGEHERVLAAGENLRLAEAGNHCQGTLFCDGADLITPALSSVIDEICDRYPGGLDFGRFDIRYESDDRLREGKGFAIVEMNGTSAEATNLYDPSRGLLWSYGVLFGQWRHLYRLGRARMKQGHRPWSLAALRAEIKKHFGERSGSAVAD